MIKLVGSSNPEDVTRDEAVRHLAERAVLTRSVCRELLECNGRFDGRRPATALGLLLTWIGKHYPHEIGLEPRPLDGLERTAIPAGCEALFLEVRAGSEVAAALKMLWTADNPLQSDSDRRQIREKLAEYWAVHQSAAEAPAHHSSWSGI